MSICWKPHFLAGPALAMSLWLTGGCTSDPASQGDGLCPSCAPYSGGETGDFGGARDETTCNLVTRRQDVAPDQLEALGFDETEIRRRLAREIDEPLVWTERDSEKGGPASGFEPHTRVHARLAASSFAHMRPDPAFCDGVICRYAGEEVEQNSCPHWLEMELSVELETLDGAVRVRATGEAVQWAEGFDDLIGEDTADEVVCHAYTDLREVTGSLKLAPSFDNQPYFGVLSLAIGLSATSSNGWIQPALWSRPLGLDDWTPRYAPLEGSWPEVTEQAQAAASDTP